jgi:Na+-driven multidrug efflux pump
MARPPWQARVIGVAIGALAGLVVHRSAMALGWTPPSALIFGVAFTTATFAGERLTRGRWPLGKKRVGELLTLCLATTIVFALLLHYWG